MKGVSRVDIIIKGRQTGVAEEFRQHALARLGKLQKLDRKVIRVDVELSTERNPRQASRRERVELTIQSRGPLVRAQAAAADVTVAFDRAAAKLEERLRRLCDRRKAARHGMLAAGHAEGTRAGEFRQAVEPQAAAMRVKVPRAPSLRAGVLPAGDFRAGDFRAGVFEAGDFRAGELRAGELRAAVPVPRRRRAVRPGQRAGRRLVSGRGGPRLAG